MEQEENAWFANHVPTNEGNHYHIKPIDSIADKKYEVEYAHTDAFIKKAKSWLAEIYRVCDITDEHGYRISLRELQARFEQYMNE